MASRAPDLATLQQQIGYEFAREELLLRSLTHRSFANESGEAIGDNERLEFLGDAVLDLLVGELLMERFPELGEGPLSMTRAQMVSEPGLERVARELDLGAWLRLGVGEERTGGRQKASLLSDAFEAVLGAMYQDGGLEPCRALVRRTFEKHVPDRPGTMKGDHKTRLQERAQRGGGEGPSYQVVDEEGPDHAKLFTVEVSVGDRILARARGRSKKSAEQEAARLALDALDSEI